MLNVPNRLTEACRTFSKTDLWSTSWTVIGSLVSEGERRVTERKNEERRSEVTSKNDNWLY
jgi:hypothetical protein